MPAPATAQPARPVMKDPGISPTPCPSQTTPTTAVRTMTTFVTNPDIGGSYPAQARHLAGSTGHRASAIGNANGHPAPPQCRLLRSLPKAGNKTVPQRA